MPTGGERSLAVRLRADVQGYVANMSIAAKATRDVAAAATKSAADHDQAWGKAGRVLVGFGAVAIGAVGVATKAAIDWESAWAGVRKTVDGSDEEMAALEAELRGLAKTLPATHREIAAVAEAAGQLGVKRKDIAAFTRIMVDLGETTNLSADEAATSIAQLMNIMGTAPKDVGRLGASLVALGNDGASTERDIIQMAQRIAGAGKTIGLTEADVLAFANALSSMGVEVEAGGTAISTAMLKIDKAVASGGDDLVKFARVAGMSSDDFAKAFKEKPAQAIQAFVGGLGRIQAEGGNTTATLDDLGLGGIRVSDSLRRLSSNTDVLNNSLALGASSWRDNTALAAEAEKRYETTAAQIQVTKNNITDAAIGFGEVLLPAIKSASEVVRDFSGWLGGLNDGQKQAVVGLGVLAGGAALTAGAFLLVFPRVIDAVKAFKQLQGISPGTASALGKVGKAAGAATVAIVGLNIAASGAWDAVAKAVPSASEATKALVSTDDSVGALDKTLREFRDNNNGYGFDDLESGLRSLSDPGLANRLADITGEITSLGQSAGRTERTHLVESLKSTGEALATLAASGDAELAAKQFDAYEAAAKAAGMSTEDLLDMMPAYRDALADASAQQTLAAQSAEPLAKGISGVALTSEEAKDALDQLSAALQGIFTSMFSVEAAVDAYEQGLLDLTEAAKDNSQSLEGNSAEALANRDQLRGLVQDGLNVLDVMSKQGASSDELKTKSGALREEFFKVATDLGFNREQVERYAAAFDAVPGVVDSIVQVETSTATAKLDAFLLRMSQVKSKTVDITVNGRVTGQRLATFQDLLAAKGHLVESATSSGVRVKAYAGGDVRNGHQAEIAPAGAWRVWAEDETGGEAYTPLANDWRRPRAVAITRDVAQRFGYDLVPAVNRVRAFADGSIIGGRPVSAPAGRGRATVEVNVTADAPLAHAYAEQVAQRTVTKWRDAIALYGLSEVTT